MTVKGLALAHCVTNFSLILREGHLRYTHTGNTLLPRRVLPRQRVVLGLNEGVSAR
jgi:hypothetical protein